MDDLDKFLDEVTTTVPPPASTASTASTEKDDDFLAFLDAPITETPIKSGISNTGNLSVSTNKPLDTDDDFLEWLQDSPRTQKKTLPSKPDPNGTERKWEPNESFIETQKHLHHEFADTSKESMDDFFNDVFGSPNQSTKSLRAGILPDGDDSTEMSVDERIRELVQSSFPDIPLLRKTICQAGVVPSTWRAQVWSLLLNESCVEDEEVRHFTSQGSPELEALISDCAAVIASSGLPAGAAATEEARRDMQDILALYCQRRNIHYHPVLCRLLSPLLALPERASRTLASSCFYTVASSFAPLLSLPSPAQQVGLGVTHCLLRLLVSYHAPSLVQHLDRVLPHWEEPAAELSAHQSVRLATAHKRNNELDDLERELGLDVLDDALTAATRGAELAIESALPARDKEGGHSAGAAAGGTGPGRNSALHSRTNSGISVLSGSGHGHGPGVPGRGCVPSHWILGIFTGSLPPEQAAWVLDWAILSDSPYAGLYLAAALLKVFEQSLLKLPGPRIRQWFEEVGMNKPDWYRNLSVSVPEGIGSSVQGGDVKFLPDDWAAFAKGWIHCATALIRSTPQAFKTTVGNTAEWAQLKAEQRAARLQQRRLGRDKGMDAASHGSTGGEGVAAGEAGSPEADSSGDEGADGSLPDASGSHHSSHHSSLHDDGLLSPAVSAASSAQAGKSTLMQQFRRLSLAFQSDNAAPGSPVKSPFARLRVFPHERLHAGHASSPLCLTSTVDEVVPCICSNRKRAVAPEDLVQSFYAVAFSPSAQRAAQPVVLSTEAFENQVFYFGVDCRTVQERALGQFPKAYAFDPSGLAEPEEVTKLLEMVETMAASAHLCLIGTGDDFVRWVYEQQQAQSRRSSAAGPAGSRTDPPEVNRAIEEGAARLNAVAMFFLKKGFKHVSILEGGFTAAAKYLQEPGSPLSLTAALVDCDRAALESLLGIQPAAAAPGGQAGRRDSFVSYLTESSGAAPSKLLSVGSLFGGGKGSTASSAVTSPAPAATSTATHSAPAPTASTVRSASPTPTGVATHTAAPTAGAEAASSSTAASMTAAAGEAAEDGGTKQLLSSWGKKLTMFSASSLESIKKVATASAAAIAVAAEATSAPLTSTGATDDDSDSVEGDDGMGPREIADTTGVSISRTDKEREQALALHKMAGLRKGDSVVINRQELPGAILFPSIKYKEVMVDASATGDATSTVHKNDTEAAAAEVATTAEGSAEEVTPVPAAASEAPVAAQAATGEKVAQQVQVHRYLVVSRERFIVLDASGGGVGSKATVKSNRHLTELIKMTFKKKDPELVTLYFVSPDHPAGKARQYRVSKRQEFVTALQKNMERFR